jgi:hypothetical protein
MRTWLICSVAVAVTAVVSFTLGLHARPAVPPSPPPVIQETTIWQTDCGVTPEPGERLEKL